MADADLRRWVVSAVALTRLPGLGSEVYYFPQGHAEQWSLAAPQAAQPRLACTVADIELSTTGEEPFARITLIPANHGNQVAADARPGPDSYLYFSKVLANADIQRSYLAVPRVCADSVFPMFVVTQDTIMSDLRGEAYVFTYRIGQKRELGGEWPKFLADKGPPSLKVGDSVVFVRRIGDQSLYIEARRQPPLVEPGVHDPVQELATASQLAAQGNAFTVTYYPGRGSRSPFVVSRGAVDEAMGKHWEEEMEVTLRPSDLVLPAHGNQGAQLEVITGRINTVTPDNPWRNLQVTIDASGAVTNKNMWEVVAVRAQPAAAKKPKTTIVTDAGPGVSKEAPKVVTLMGVVIGTTGGTGC